MPDDMQDIEFTDQDFERVRTLLRTRVGISLNPSKRQLVYNRLAKRVREFGHHGFADYLDQIDQDKEEQERFINALTTNLTSFFREEHHFPALADYLQTLPERAPIQIWCAASSTGEEPYSIAITALEALGEAALRRVSILASDLDTHVLEKAQRGVYRLEQLAKIPKEILRRYFLKGRGQHAGFGRVRPEVQSMITFRQINLLDSNWPVKGPLDAIFCRNVMIYFDKPTQLHIIEKFLPLMSDKARLFVGHSESFSNATHLIRLCGRTIYQKASATESPS